MTTLLNDHESDWQTSDLNTNKALQGGKAVCIVGIRSTDASPITDVTFNAASFTQDRKVDGGDVVTELWSLESPTNGTKAWTIDETVATNEYYADLMDWAADFAVYQHAQGTAGGSDGATETLTGTTLGSKVYCALFRDGTAADAGLTIDGTEITHPAESPNQRAWIIASKPGTGGNVSFTWSADNARDTACILWEVKTLAGGNQVIMVM